MHATSFIASPRVGWFRCAIAVVVLAASTGISSDANAQELAREMGSALTPMPKSLIDKSRSILSLDDDQYEIVVDLYQGYRSAYRQIVEESDAKRRQIWEKARDGDRDAAEIKARENMKKALADLVLLDTTFSDDLRAILSGDQLVKFEAFERAKRRDSTRHSSMLSGEGADPIDILQHLKIDTASLTGYEAMAAEYAESMDRQILARSAIWKSGYDAYLAGDNWKRLRDDYPKLYVVAKQIRDTNRRYARQIAELLTEEERTKFDEEFRRRSYPTIYREGVITKRLKAARAVEALSDSQKDQLQIVEHAYDRDAETINAKWRSSLDRVQDLIAADANKGWNSTEAQTVRDVVAERVQLDKKYLDKIDAVLTEAQLSTVPAATRDVPRMRGDVMPEWDRDSVRKWLQDKN